jgi:hypothetical protein
VRIHISGNQWDSFATGEDFGAAVRLLRKAFDQFPLHEEGFSFAKLYWDQYYVKLGNKAGVLSFLAYAKMYFHGVRSDPRSAFRRPGLKAGTKLVASAVLPRRLIRWLRLRRQARQIAGVRSDGRARLTLKRPLARNKKDAQRRAAV